jgi:hypothetical protein
MIPVAYTFPRHSSQGDGTYSIGVEARRSEETCPGTTAAQTIQYGAKNQVVSFAVDGRR